MLRLRFIDDGGEDVGEKDCQAALSWVDPVLTATSFFGVLTAVPELSNINSANVFGSNSDGDMPDIFVEISIGGCDSYFKNTLLAEMVNNQRAELCETFGVTYMPDDQKAPSQVNEGAFDWYDDTVTCLHAKLPFEVTYAQLEEKLRALDGHIAKIRFGVEAMSEGVISASAPTRQWWTRSAFICHSSKDKQFARKLSARLEKERIKVWLDEDQILCGHDFVERMEDGLTKSDFVVVVLTPNILNGPWAKEEYRATLTRQVEQEQVVLLPALRQCCDLPPFLKPKLYADFTKDYRVGFRTLLTALRRHPVMRVDRD